jgi:hypothetical protein
MKRRERKCKKDKENGREKEEKENRGRKIEQKSERENKIGSAFSNACNNLKVD